MENVHGNLYAMETNTLFPLPEVPLADSLLLDVPLLDVPLADVPQALDPEPIDPEVAEQESSWRIISNMSLDKELMSLLFPSLRELACESTNINKVPLRKLIERAPLWRRESVATRSLTSCPSSRDHDP